MQWKTIVVCVAFIAAIVLLGLFGGDGYRVAVIGVLGVIGTAVGGLMRGAFHVDAEEPAPDTQREPNASPKPPRVPPIGLAAVILAGCGAAAAEKGAAESAYLAQQVECIDANQTKAAIDVCRDAVKQAWANADAGSDGDR